MRFKVLIHGTNLMVSREGEIARIGFYATRHIEASNANAAASAAIEALWNEEELRLRANLSSSLPQLEVQEVEALGWLAGRTRTASGFTFYEIDDSDDFELESPRQTAYRIECEAGKWRSSPHDPGTTKSP